MKKLFCLFFEFFKISLFVIGGGYSILVVADQVFSRKGWIDEDELIEHLPVFQMVPGLIATHTAIYVGNRVAGPLGSLVGVVAVAIPSVAIFTAVSVWYRAIPLDNPWLNSAFVGLRAALTGIIAAAIVKSWRRFMTDAFAYALLVAGVASLVVGVPVWAVLVASMGLGLMSIRTKDRGLRTKAVSWLPLLYFLQYGALCFGGGFVIVPMYLADFVGPDAAYLQLTGEEFSNIMAVSQMTPGPIGVNCATFFGFRLAGIPGAIVASALLLLPGSLMAWFVFRSLDLFKTSRIVRGILRGVRPASIALMLVALWAFAKMTVVSSDGKSHIIGAILVILTVLMVMKKKLNVILLIVLCAFAACVLRAEDQAKVKGEGEQGNVSNSTVQPSTFNLQPSDYPDADSVTLSEIERVEYQPDGTSVSVSEVWSKILTERGRREESELKLGYNKRYSSAKVLYVGAVGTNGVEREIDVSGTMKDMTDNSSLAENIVDPEDRELVCTIPGLQVGETVHVKIERSTFKSRIKDQWSDVVIMEWTCPILKSVYEVKAPKERPIRSRAVRHPLGNVTEEVKPQPDGSTLYVYTATNSPRMFPEPDMPPQWTQVQSVHLSTAQSWPELSRWYWDVCLPHLEKTNPAMTNKVEELGRDMKRIFKFVSQDIRYMGLTMEDTAPGYAPHDVDITFDNRYGVCRDKGALLVAMLRIAGYKAFPVLINVGAKQDPDVPKPYFNHAITCVEVDDVWKFGGVEGLGVDANIQTSKHPNFQTSKPRYILMDPTNENTKDLLPGYLCNCSYLVARPEGDELRTSPVPPQEANAVNVKTRGKLRDDGIVVLESTLDFTGINDTIYRGALAKATPEKRVKFFESRMKALQPGAELVKCDITPEDMRDTTIPLHVELLAKLPESVLRGETEDALAVPFVSRTFSIANWLLAGNTSLEKRRYPLVIDTTAQVKESVEIDLGTALGDVKALPETTNITNDYSFLRSFSVSNGTLRAERTHAVKSVEFSPEAYAKMREDIKAVEAVERKNPVFVADGLKNANVNWLLESTDVDIASDTEWTVTNTVVKEVLTYKGKKDSAEMKFSYNPMVRSFKVLSATVSNLNGVVSHVKPVEMNEVDASWAAAAPRYPAGKTLIVNLPAVEVGSVISVTTVSTITNAPASYYGSFGFDAKEPLVRRRVRVDGWTRDVTHPRRIPDEPNQPAAHLWRDVTVVTKNDFGKAAKALRLATDVAALDPSTLNPQPSTSNLQSLRDWMAKHIRIAGPSLYEVPIAQQLTDPKVVIEERYASRLDYIRTLCALLKGAGYDADIVFAAQNASLSEEARKRDKYELPNVRAFATVVCRVRETTGGFLGFGGETMTYFIGTENEYTPLGATALEGCDFFDPEAEAFGVIAATDKSFAPNTASEAYITVRENGAVDYKFESKLWGAGVGAFRKLYAEILPEDFSRHYQQLLGSVSKAASATKELTPDIKSYPASLSFECFIPDFATVEGDTITVKLPPFDCPVPALPGSVRETPVALGAQDISCEEVVVRFPKGYTEVEHMPKTFVLDERHGLFPRLRNDVWTKTVDGCLEVHIRRAEWKRPNCFFSADYAELFRDWRRRATSLASRTVIVRKATR